MDQLANHRGSRSDAGPTTSAELPHVLHWDEWLSGETGRIAAIVEEVVNLLPAPTVTPGRSPRSDAAQRRRVAAETLVANLVVVILSPMRYASLAVPMASARGSRYDRRAFSREVLRTCVTEMHEAGFLTLTEAVFRQQRTTISPTERFRLLVQKHGVTLGDIGRVRGRETIELWAAGPKHQRKERIEYRDTQETERLRAEMETINAHLSRADIRYGGQPLYPVGHLVRKFRAGGVGEPHGFNLHGRLYGGVWETLPKSQRHLLTIDGEELSDLDFSAMFVRLAYCRQGVQPPAGDLYAIPGLAGFRHALKPVVNSLFFRQKEATRLPAEAREALPGDWTMGRVKVAVAALHPAIVPLFDTNIGMELFAAEAEILVAVLLALFAVGITALNMHDGILVAQSKRKYAMETMRRVSFEKTGFVFEVCEKSVRRPLGE